MIRYLKTILILLLTLSCSNLSAQKYGHALIDSLQLELTKAKEDTNKVKLVGRLSECYGYNFDSSLYYAEKADTLVEKLNWHQGMAMINRTIGVAYYLHRNYAKGLEYFFKSLKICEDDGDKENEEKVLSQLVYLFNTCDDFEKSLEYATRILKLEEATRDTEKICNGLYIFYDIYETMHNYPKALEYSFKLINIYKKTGDKRGIGYTDRSVGSIYSSEGDYNKALEYDSMSLKMSEESHDTDNIKWALLDIGSIYHIQNNDSTALEYYRKIIKIDENACDKKAITNDYYPLIDIYLKQHNYSKALEYGFMILRNNKQNDTVNIKYALGKIGLIYFKIATDTTGTVKADDLIPAGKTANLIKARDYFIQSGIQTTLLIFFKYGRSGNGTDYYPELIETQKLLGDYEGAFESLKAAQARDDRESSAKNNGLMSALEVKKMSDDLEKQIAIDKITQIKKRNVYVVKLK